MATNDDDFRDEKRTLSIEMPELYWKRIDRLVEAHGHGYTVEQFVGRMLDHVQQGVYRSGAWERGWLQMLVGTDTIEEAWGQDEARR